VCVLFGSLCTGAYWDLVQAYRILEPGGWIFIHDCYPVYIAPTPDNPNPNNVDGTGTNQVRLAVRDFTSALGLTWNLIVRTMFMAGIQKPLAG
jgi:hypothetical protein